MLCTRNSQELEFLTAIAQGVCVFRMEINAFPVGVELTNAVGKEEEKSCCSSTDAKQLYWIALQTYFTRFEDQIIESADIHVNCNDAAQSP